MAEAHKAVHSTIPAFEKIEADYMTMTVVEGIRELEGSAAPGASHSGLGL